MPNSYATLTDYKQYSLPRNQTMPTTDANDDAVMTRLLESASRFMDTATRRQFYPSLETDLYDLPRDILYLDSDKDLLELTTLTNGDGVVITSSDYVLRSNRPPYWAISIRDTSSVAWETNSAGSAEQVISVNGVFGYHDNYTQRAWLLGGTLGAAMSDTTTLTFTSSAGHSLVVGQIVKIGSEFLNITGVSTNTITINARGDNGTTAATHLISTPIYIWQPMENVRQSVIEIANSAYQRRFGRNTGESATVTAAGVVLTPKDIPTTAKATIQALQRLA